MTEQSPFKRTYEANPETEPRTESVTRPQLPTQPPEIYQCLLAGIDSLDIGIHVDWGEDWDERFEELEELKRCASQNDDPVLIELPGVNPYLVRPTGKAPMYRFHLQTSDYHLWIGKSRMSENNTPNLYVSLNSEPIWRDGLETVIDRLKKGITALGAKIMYIQPSRADLCADFYIPDGFDLYELIEQTVCGSGARNIRMELDNLETYYVGSDGADVQLRLYDKSREIEVHPDRAFFEEFWNVPPMSRVWRTEFQMRRPFLLENSINTLDDLLAGCKSIWNFLTVFWAKIHTGTDSNKSRRPLSPFWEAVQQAGELFQGDQPLKKRRKRDSSPQERWYLARIRNHVETLAALWQEINPVETLRIILERLRNDWHGERFAEQVMLKAIKKGWPIPGGILPRSFSANASADGSGNHSCLPSHSPEGGGDAKEKS
jgi:hypothetical protein